MQLVSEGANVLLIDGDFPVASYPYTIQHAYEAGAETVLYSHGAPVITAWDGIWRPGPLTRLYLAQSPGQKWVMNTYKYPIKVEVIGWHYCEQRLFQPCNDVKKVLFAPEHPHTNGYMLAEAREITEKINNLLNDLPFDVVRHDGPVPLDISVMAIDQADVVVSYPGTFATLAVARGKPVVMYGQDICPHDGYSDEMLKYVKHWDDYRDYMRYPYDISHVNARAAESIIRNAAINEAVDWKLKFVGHSIDPENLVKVLKRELRY